MWSGRYWGRWYFGQRYWGTSGNSTASTAYFAIRRRRLL